MTCSGKTQCKIYREKKYCRKLDVKQKEYDICDCRHAALACEVGRCVMEDVCKKEWPSLDDLLKRFERQGGKP